MVSVIIFDLWDTLATSESITAALAERFGDLDEDFLRRYEQAIMLEKHDLPEMAEKLLDALDRPITQENLEYVEDTVKNGRHSARIIDGMQTILSHLQERYRLAVLSNNTWFARDVITMLGLAPYFEEEIYSFRAGALKPDHRAFAHACDELGAEPEECILVDDNADNIEAAEDFGMGAILFIDAEDLKGRLEKHGIL